MNKKTYSPTLTKVIPTPPHGGTGSSYIIPQHVNVPRKSKRERFLTVAQRRTIKVLCSIRLLARCSNLASYRYTANEVDRIISAIQVELDSARIKFETNLDIQFSLTATVKTKSE